MPRDSILLDLLRKPDWEQFQPLVDRLQRWIFYPLFLRRRGGPESERAL